MHIFSIYKPGLRHHTSLIVFFFSIMLLFKVVNKVVVHNHQYFNTKIS